MTTPHIAALRNLRIGVAMDLQNLDDGEAKLAALDAAIAALAHPQQPSGWRLAPVEPTDEMARAGEHWAKEGFDWPKAIYRAMTKVAPAHPAAHPSRPYGGDPAEPRDDSDRGEGQEGGDALRERVRDAIAAAIGGDAYDCGRVWDAWSVGTMGEDDFLSIVDQDERLDEITDAAIAAMTGGSQ